MGLRPLEGDEKRFGPATCPGVPWTTVHKTATLSFLSSRVPRRAVGAKPSDLRFHGPLVEMFFDGAKRLVDLSHKKGFRREVEEPVLSGVEGTSAMTIGRCDSELSGHMATEGDYRAREDDPVTVKCVPWGEIEFSGWVVEKLRTPSAQRL